MALAVVVSARTRVTYLVTEHASAFNPLLSAGYVVFIQVG